MSLHVPNHHVIVPDVNDVAIKTTQILSTDDDKIYIELFGDSILCGRDPDLPAPECGVCSNTNPIVSRVAQPPASLIEFFLPQYKLVITTRSSGNSTSGQLLNGTDGVNGPWPDYIEANVVVINHGTNDAKLQVPLDKYRTNLIDLRKGLRSDQIVVWMTPTKNYIWNTDPYAEVVREVAGYFQDIVADANRDIKPNWLGELPDGLHPRQVGYAELVDLCLAPKINQAILRHLDNKTGQHQPHLFYRKDHQEKFVLDNEDQLQLGFAPLSNSWLEVYYRNNQSFRAVSRGYRDLYGILKAGLWDADSGIQLSEAKRSYNLTKIRREDGKVIYHESFDLFSDPAEAKRLADVLNATSSDYIVVVTTYDEPRDNRFHVELVEAMYRCGASPEIFGSPNFKFRSSYILVGIPGWGPGQGIEAYNGVIDATDANTINSKDPNAFKSRYSKRRPKPRFYPLGKTNSQWSSLLNTYSIFDSYISANVTILELGNVTSTLSGLSFTDGLVKTTHAGYYWDDVNFFSTSAITGKTASGSAISDGIPGSTSFMYTGYFIPKETATYTFYTTSDDASHLWVGAVAESGWTTTNAVVNNGGLHGWRGASGSIALTAGVYYPIRIVAGNNGGPGGITVQYSTPSVPTTTDMSGMLVQSLSNAVGQGILNLSGGLIAHWVINSSMNAISDSMAPAGFVSTNNVNFAFMPVSNVPAIAVGLNNDIGYVATANATKFQLTAVLGQSLTIEALIYPVFGPSPGGMILNKDSEYEIAIMPNNSQTGTIAVALDWGGADSGLPGGGWYYTPVEVPWGIPTHIAWVVDNTDFYIYKNGQLAHTQNGLNRNVQPSSSPVVIGNRPGAGQQFRGYIADVRLWNRARAADEIAATKDKIVTGLRFDGGIIPLLKNFKPDVCDSPSENVLVIGEDVTQTDLIRFGITDSLSTLSKVKPDSILDWQATYLAKHHVKIGYWMWDAATGPTTPLTEELLFETYPGPGNSPGNVSGQVIVPQTFTPKSILVFGIGDVNSQDPTGMRDIVFKLVKTYYEFDWTGQYYQWEVFFPMGGKYNLALSADNTANIAIKKHDQDANSFLKIGETVGTFKDQYGKEHVSQFTVPDCGWYNLKMYHANYNDIIEPPTYYAKGDTLNGTWSSLLNTYGVWEGNGNYYWEWQCPASGNYTFSLSIDNYGDLQIKKYDDPDTMFKFVVSAPGFSTEYTRSNYYVTAGLQVIKIYGVNTGGPGSLGATIKDSTGTIIWSTLEMKKISGLYNMGVAGVITNSDGDQLWNTRHMINAKKINEINIERNYDVYNSYSEIEFDISSTGVPFAVDVYPPFPESLNSKGNLTPMMTPGTYEIVSNVPPVNGTRLLNPQYARPTVKGTPSNLAAPKETFHITKDYMIKFSRPLTGVVTVVCDTATEPSKLGMPINVQNVHSMRYYTQRFNPGRWAQGANIAATGNAAPVMSNDTGPLATRDYKNTAKTNELNLYNSQIRLRVGDSHYAEPMVIAQPQNGYVRISTDRKKMVYTPFPDFYGNDAFTYTMLTQHGQAGPTKSVYVQVGMNPALVPPPTPTPPGPPAPPPPPPPPPTFTITPKRIDQKENVRYAVFTITNAPAGDTIDFKTSGTAFSGFDYISTLQWSEDGGANWFFYNVTSKPIWQGSPIQVRITVINDTQPEVTESILVQVTGTPSGATDQVDIYISD